MNESEMHLHPQWQYELSDRYTEYQVIYIKHSVTMIGMRYAENIYRISQTSGK